MGEAKRRKKSDPTFGKISFKPSKQELLNTNGSDIDFLKSLVQNMNNYQEEEELITIHISFDYQVKCNLENGQEILDSGHLTCTKNDYFDIDGSSPFQLAYEIALHHFYRFQIEKKGLQEMSNISITINNLESNYS